MGCKQCGRVNVTMWADDSRFCSASCRDRFYGEAAAAPRVPETLDEVIFETLVADYPNALKEWGTQAGRDVQEYLHPERAEIYAEHVMRSPFGVGHGIGLRAAHNDYAPEYPPRQRPPLQERLRARIAKFIAPTFKTNQQERADAYARARVDALDAWASHYAIAEAVGARLHAAVPEAEHRAFEAEQHYAEGRRRW
jgi:hypothetical protein